MKRLLILISFISGFSYYNEAYAQNLEAEIFGLISSDLSKQQRFNAVKSSLKGVRIVIDPITSERSLNYDDLPTKKAITSKYAEKELWEILSISDQPTFSAGDTITILDTISFFSNSFEQSTDGCYIKVASNYNISSANKLLLLHKIRINKNILSFVFLSPKNPDRVYLWKVDVSNGNYLSKGWTFQDKPGFE